jgi:Ca2+-binding EF-hand superfamily protein
LGHAPLSGPSARIVEDLLKQALKAPDGDFEEVSFIEFTKFLDLYVIHEVKDWFETFHRLLLDEKDHLADEDLVFFLTKCQVTVGSDIMDEALAKLGFRRGQTWTFQDCVSFLVTYQDIDAKKRYDRFYLTPWIHEQMHKVTISLSKDGALKVDDLINVADAVGVYAGDAETWREYQVLAQDRIEEDGLLNLGEVGPVIRKMFDKQEQLARDRAHMDAKMSELEIETFRDVFDELDEEGRSVLLIAKVEERLRRAGLRFQGEQMQLFERTLVETAGVEYHQSEGKMINFAQFLDLVNMMIRTNFADTSKRESLKQSFRRASTSRGL